MPNRNRHYINFIAFLLLLLMPPVLMAQNPPVTYYTVEQGLPSGEVYGMEFDSLGILWAVTDRGITRYDGYHFKQFTVSDGLPDNTILRIYKDVSSQIWFSSIAGDLLYVQHDSVIVSPFSRITRPLRDSLQYIQKITPMPDQSLIISFNRPGLLKILPNGDTVWLNRIFPNHKEAPIYIFDSLGYTYWNMVRYPPKDPSIKTRVAKEGIYLLLNCGIKHNQNDFRKYHYPIGPNDFLFTTAHKVFHIKEGKCIEERNFPFEVMSVYVDHKGGFWVAVDKLGVFYYKDGNLKHPPQQYFRDELITCVRQDHENNYWFTTRGNGILMVKSFDLISYVPESFDQKDQVITALTILNDTLFYGTLSGKIFYLDEGPGGLFSQKRLNFRGDHGPCRKLISTPRGTLIVVKDSIWEINPRGSTTGIHYHPNYAYNATVLPDGRTLTSSSRILRIFNRNQMVFVVDSQYIHDVRHNDRNWMNITNTIRAMFVDSSNRIWLGSHYRGVYTWEGDQLFYWGDLHDQLKNRTRDIIQVGDRIVFASSANGLLVLNPDTSFLEINYKYDKLSSDIIDVLYAENDSVFWAGTNRGLNRIQMGNNPGQPVDIKYYTYDQGLPSNRIYGICSYRGRLWVGTSKGLVSVNELFTKPLAALPKLHLEGLVVNKMRIDPDERTAFTAKENNFEFIYKGITYRNHDALSYRYRLIPFEKNWNYTQNLTASYTKLAGKSYQFQIQAAYVDGEWNSPGLEYTFTIKKHLLKTWVSISLMILLFLFILYISITHFIRGVKKREQRKQHLLMAEKQALVSQMNPHFIFNSLNSIQHFILQKDDFQANNYLTNFSSLIRRILENSKRNLIGLNESIETLHLYLTMEKLRFEDKFEFNIQRDPSLDGSEILIPPMMIQPIVENAIWHGITPLEKNGHITISFIGNLHHYHCIIEDNGIGRKKSREMKGKKKNHVSTGIRNIQDRTDLMNQMNKGQISFIIEDLYYPDGSASGTRVTFKFPINWE